MICDFASSLGGGHRAWDRGTRLDSIGPLCSYCMADCLSFFSHAAWLIIQSYLHDPCSVALMCSRRPVSSSGVVGQHGRTAGSKAGQRGGAAEAAGEPHHWQVGGFRFHPTPSKKCGKNGWMEGAVPGSRGAPPLAGWWAWVFMVLALLESEGGDVAGRQMEAGVKQGSRRQGKEAGG